MKRGFTVNLAGRVNNFKLPRDRPLIPLYEAIVNSIHAIEDRQKADANFVNGEITIQIVRSGEEQLFSDTQQAPVSGFIVSDNGVGFNSDNMHSFMESDSDYKAETGGKGVGRFSWLKAFKKVNISSTFQEDQTLNKRDFLFSAETQEIDDSLIEVEEFSSIGTTITLAEYYDDYVKAVPKKLETITQRIIQHCLVYLLGSNCPELVVVDEDESTSLNQVFREKFQTEDNVDNFELMGETFQLLHVKIEESSFPGNRLYLCANSRLVLSVDLDKHIVDLDSHFYDESGFLYVGVLTGAYLDNNVDMNRLSFNVPDKAKDDELLKQISIEEIVNKSCSIVRAHLSEQLIPISQEKQTRIAEYIDKNAPQYKHLQKYMPEDLKRIKPNLSDDKLDEALYSLRKDFDRQTAQDEKLALERLAGSDALPDDYERVFRERVEKLTDSNRSALAEYVVRRKTIIDFLEKSLGRQDDEKFIKEKYIHGLFYPMNHSSDELNYESHNLWLIDERLSYSKFISSDVPFDKDPKQERPDVLMLDRAIAVSDDDSESVYGTVVIFEFKKPMRNDYGDGDNPITQLLNYANKIKSKDARDKNHRIINVNESTQFYLYAICDLTDKVLSIVQNYGYTKTPDGLGYFGYNPQYNAYIEVLSYDKILADSKKRNRILFEKLKE